MGDGVRNLGTERVVPCQAESTVLQGKIPLWSQEGEWEYR